MKQEGFMATTLNFAITKYIKVLNSDEFDELSTLQKCSDDFQIQHSRENYVFKKIVPIMYKYLAGVKQLSSKEWSDLRTSIYRIMELTVDAHSRKMVVEPTTIEYMCEARLILSVVCLVPEVVEHPNMVAEYLQYLVSKRILI